MDPFESYSLDKKSGIPVWVQLKQRFLYLILSGAYQPGEQLPTVRETAARLGINYHTVNKVYHDLENSGLVEMQVGRGTCIRDRSENQFIAFENDARMVAREFSEKLLQLGMTPEEIIRAVANHLHVKVTVEKADRIQDALPEEGKERRVG